MNNYRVVFFLAVFLGLSLMLVIGVGLNLLLTPYKDISLEEYKKQVNSSLSDQEFIDELFNQNLAQRRMIGELEEEVANKDIIIGYLADRLNMSLEVNTSPFSMIQRDDIRVFNDRIIIYANKVFGATFTESRSMYPFIRKGVFALEVKPGSTEELRVGDVIGFKSKVFNTTIIHRIVDISYDEEGWFAVTKGDNNPAPDPGKVRFEEIHGLLVGLIY